MPGSILNTLQAKLEGEVNSDGNTAGQLSLDECVNLFFSLKHFTSKTVLIILNVIHTPKYGSYSEERSKDCLTCFVSSVVAMREIYEQDLARYTGKTF